MSLIVTPAMPFPNIYWWSEIINNDGVLIDILEHYEKMSLRNRYIISSGNGPLALSVPLLHGREQRKPVNEVLISNQQNWQIQHWRTITSAYRRSPFFEYYEQPLEAFYKQPFEKLVEFNLASVALMKSLTNVHFTVSLTDTYQKNYPGKDLRKSFNNNHHNEIDTTLFPRYYQVFEERHGFLPNLSILDLLFSEGPALQSALMQIKN